MGPGDRDAASADAAATVDTGPGVDSPTDDDRDDGRSLPIGRGTLLRLVIVVAIGIPIVLEGVTFVGLVGNQLEDGTGGTPADGEAPANGVDIGDDILPATDRAELLSEASVETGDGWRFTMAVNVTNSGEDGYRLRIVNVTTGAGTTVTGAVSTDPMAAGERTVLRGTWDLPDGEIPGRVTVIATVPTADGSRTVTRTVTLETVDVRG